MRYLLLIIPLFFSGTRREVQPTPEALFYPCISTAVIPDIFVVNECYCYDMPMPDDRAAFAAKTVFLKHHISGRLFWLTQEEMQKFNQKKL